MTYHEMLSEACRKATLEYLEALLSRHHGNVTQAAKEAGVKRESLHRIMRRYGLKGAGPGRWRDQRTGDAA